MKTDAERDAALERFARDVREGLANQTKSLPSQYFYDGAGSRLFEEITTLPEYYPTRTEIAILRSCASDIACRTGVATALVEFGSGSSVKTNILFDAAPAIDCYVPIDVSPSIMDQAIARLQRERPRLQIVPVVADFSADVTLPPVIAGRPRLGFFPGSTIGNFKHEHAVALLSRFRVLLGAQSRLVLGADLRKSPSILLPAYDDARGVTAAFNLNLLARINRELGGTFDLEGFTHLATYDEKAGRIDMHLVSRRDQTADVGEHRYSFLDGERIHTEISQKYEIDELQGLARAAGWLPVDVWTDPDRLFSVHEFETARS